MGLIGALPARVPAEVKELVLKTVDEAVAEGFGHGWACSLWRVSDDRVHRWRAQHREHGTLVDRAPGGNPMHGILPAEIDAILAVAEQWGPIDRSHRKLAHRGSYQDLVWVAPYRRHSGEFWLLTGLSYPNSRPAPAPTRSRGRTG